MFVAPVTVGDGAYTGAGTVVRKDVPPGALAVNVAPAAQPRGLGAGRSGPAPPPPQAADGAPSAPRPHRPPDDAQDHHRRDDRTMTGIKRTTEKNLMVFSGRAHPELAEEVAEQLGTELVPTTAYDFANGEIYVRFEESVRGCDAFVIQSHTAPINEWIMEHLIMVDALKRASAKRITVVMPFYGYARQDKKHRGREPISARLMADLFKTAGADRLIAVDLHTAQIQGFFDGPVDHLMALPILAELRRETKYGRRAARRRLARRRPDQGRRAVVEPARRRAAGLHPQDPRHQPAQRGRSPTGSSVRSRAASACWSTT